MFLVMGVSSKQEKIDLNQPILCFNCDKYGRYEIFVEYTYFSLFFIPILKWNKKYYVKASCCGSIYSIDKELGENIACGKNIVLNENNMHLIKNGQRYSLKRCSNCYFETYDDFSYCPKCASTLK